MSDIEGKAPREGARSEAGLAFRGSEHGVLGSRRVDGPTAEVGGKRVGANESTSFKFAGFSRDRRNF
jgi:hypothetical protein